MSRSTTFALALALMATGTGAIAQSTNTLSQTSQRDTRAQIGIVVPFGSAGTRAERAPKVEAWNERTVRTGQIEPLQRIERGATQVAPVRFGITLDRQAQFTRNGRELARQDGQHGVSALGWVGIGVGVVVVIGGLAVAGAFGQCLTPC